MMASHLAEATEPRTTGCALPDPSDVRDHVVGFWRALVGSVPPFQPSCEVEEGGTEPTLLERADSQARPYEAIVATDDGNLIPLPQVAGSSSVSLPDLASPVVHLASLDEQGWLAASSSRLVQLSPDLSRVSPIDLKAPDITALEPIGTRAVMIGSSDGFRCILRSDAVTPNEGTPDLQAELGAWRLESQPDIASLALGEQVAAQRSRIRALLWLEAPQLIFMATYGRRILAAQAPADRCPSPGAFQDIQSFETYQVTALGGDHQRLLLGTREGGVMALDLLRKEGTQDGSVPVGISRELLPVSDFGNPHHRAVSAIQLDQDARAWVMQGTRLLLLDLETKLPILELDTGLDPRIRQTPALQVDREYGRLWLGTRSLSLIQLHWIEYVWWVRAGVFLSIGLLLWMRNRLRRRSKRNVRFPATATESSGADSVAASARRRCG